MRVISSPSISTIGFLATIFGIAPDVRPLIAPSPDARSNVIFRVDGTRPAAAGREPARRLAWSVGRACIPGPGLLECRPYAYDGCAARVFVRRDPGRARSRDVASRSSRPASKSGSRPAPAWPPPSPTTPTRRPARELPTRVKCSARRRGAARCASPRRARTVGTRRDLLREGAVLIGFLNAARNAELLDAARGAGRDRVRDGAACRASRARRRWTRCPR